MTIESDVIAELLADPFITARCGDRVSPEWRAQGAPLPALVVERVAAFAEMTTAGRSLTEVTIRVSVFAGTYEGTKDLIVYIRDLYDGRADTIGTTRVAEARRTNEGDLSSIDGDRDSRHNFIEFDFMVEE